MRSLNYIAAALLPVISSAYAGKGDDDGTTVVTQTRTVTICPVIDWATCDSGQEITTWIDRTGAPPTTTRTTSTSSGVSSSTGPDGRTTTFTRTYSGDDGWSTTFTSTYSGEDGRPTTTNKPFSSTGPYDGGYSNSTTSGYTRPDSTTSGHSAYTTPFTSSRIDTNSSTSTTSSSTTSGCFNSTRTASPYDFGDRFINGRCNKPGSRDQWCDSKSLNDDTAPVYRTGNVRKYRLEIGLSSVNADGMSTIPVFTINGKTPGDPIVANWGDDVEITVANVMDPASGRVNATTIHWHGMLQHGTNDQDGVPGVTECGIAPGTSRTYKWHAATYGTGWYHSHLLAQYGGGVRGPIIIHGPASADYDLDMGAIMIDEKFSDSIFNLANFYAKNRAVRVASNYLLNGKNQAWGNATAGEPSRWIVKSGKKHLFRIINSSAQSGFVFHIDEHKMTVVSADMVPIQPYETEYLWIHSGQRYNVIVNADQPIAAYDVRAIVQQGCGTTIDNTGLGQSNGIMEYEGSCYSTPSAKTLNFTTVGRCEDEHLSKLKPVVTKDAGDASLFRKNVENMPGGTNVFAVWPGTNTSVTRWLFGGPSPFTGTASFNATKRISVNYELPTLQLLPTVGTNDTSVYGNTVFYNAKDSWVYWVIQNQFITSHPMHLHGHDFAVLGQAYNKVFTEADIDSLNFKDPIRRDTVLLYGSGRPTEPVANQKPGYTVIGFKTDNPGAWLMHCHIIWHADGGMGIQIVERPDEIPNYYSKPEFQSECSDMKSYHAGGADRVKADYESGLKKRHLDEHKFHGYGHGHAVRHEY